MKKWFKKLQIVPQKKAMKNMIVALIMMVTFIGSFAVPLIQVHAEEGNGEKIELPVCFNFTVIGGEKNEFSPTGCVAQFSFYIFQGLSSWILSVSGEIFNTMLAVSMDKEIIDAPFANEGWKLTRDLANIAFIFILLYIALSRILQFGGPTTQSVLVRLIIIALLVNFSLFFTKVVIDSSNILAVSFYNEINADPLDTTYLSSDTSVKNISSKLVHAFKPGTLLGIGTEEGAVSFKDWANGSAEGNVGLIIIFLSSTTLNLITAYALFVVGLLFLARIGALWFLMIGAPIAFLAWIIPNTGMYAYASRWWKFLLNQSFLAPIFLFFLFLIMKFVVDIDFSGDYFGGSEAIASSGDSDAMSRMIVSVLLKAAIIIMVLLYAVKITKSLSTSAANGIVNKATGLARKAGGFAGGLVSSGAKETAIFAGGAVGRRIKGVAGKLAEKNLEDKGGRVASTLRKIPGISKTLGIIGQASRKDIEDKEKELGNLSPAALESIISSSVKIPFTEKRIPLGSSASREAATKILAKQGSFKTADGTLIKKQIESMEAKGVSKKDIKEIKKQEWQYRDLTDTTMSHSDRVDILKKVPAEAIDDLDELLFSNSDVLDAMYESFGKAQAKKISDNSKISSNFFSGMNMLGSDIASITTELDKINRNLASWIRTTDGRVTLEAEGFT